MARNYLKTLYILLTALVTNACSDVNDKNQLSVYICDSPADYGGVHFYITGVQVRTTGSQSWTPLIPGESYVALMELVNGKMQEAGRATMPQGSSYDAVRLTFSPGNAYVEIDGEGKLPLELDPADAVVIAPFPAVTMDGPNKPLLFDIDIASSVIPDPSTASGYRFRPQVTFVDIDQCGVVQGALQAGEAAVTSRIWMRFTDDATGTVSSTYCSREPAGAFFIRLVPGEYTLEVIPADAAELNPYTAKVAVTKQGVTDLGIIVLETKGL